LIHAAEQDRPDVQARRLVWHDQFDDVDAHRLVFIDESGAKSTLTRLWGRCPIGERLVAKVPHGHWHTSTIISAIRLTGPFAPAVFDGPADTDTFRAYVEQVLAPSLQPGEIVVMDNLAAHKAPGITNAIQAVGASVLYLPPYSPDFNPIEAMWSKVKSHLRSAAARTFETICHAVAEALTKVTPTDCQGFFQNCGYATTTVNLL